MPQFRSLSYTVSTLEVNIIPVQPKQTAFKITSISFLQLIHFSLPFKFFPLKIDIFFLLNLSVINT